MVRRYTYALTCTTHRPDYTDDARAIDLFTAHLKDNMAEEPDNDLGAFIIYVVVLYAAIQFLHRLVS